MPAAGDGGDINIPTAIAATPEAVWVVRLENRSQLGPPRPAPYRLERLDSRSLVPTRPTRFLSGPALLEVGPRALWIIGARGDLRVVAPDAALGPERVQRLSFGVAGMAFSARFAWVLNSYQNRLYRIERRSGRSAPGWIRPSPRAQIAIAGAPRGAWTLSLGERPGRRARGPGTLTRVGEDGRLSASRRVCREPRDVATAAGDVFVLCAGGRRGRLMRLGPVPRAVPVGAIDAVGQVVAAPDGLWVASDHALTRVDPRTLSIEAKLPLGEALPSSLAASRDGLVVALRRAASGRVCRIAPFTDQLRSCRAYQPPKVPGTKR